MTLAIGARQLVVQLALERTECSPLNCSWLTLKTSVGTWSGVLVGAEIRTRLAPPLSTCLIASSYFVKSPVDSMT